MVVPNEGTITATARRPSTGGTGTPRTLHEILNGRGWAGIVNRSAMTVRFTATNSK